ncbi:MAG: hypothetical protein K0R17_229 [Rariglobus sp.]|jgi:hypothetical protein|nr:hypothetical protein [Rariglobus sp.]
MKLTYEASLDDVIEPGVRLFMRGKTCATNRWRGALLCAAIFAVFAWLGFQSKENVNLPVVCLAAAGWGAGLFLLTYNGTVRRRIRKYATSEMKGPWPATTVIEIDAGKITSTTAGVTSAFELADLSDTAEDSNYLELRFGNKGACVIPLRAFHSSGEKAAFLAATGR